MPARPPFWAEQDYHVTHLSTCTGGLAWLNFTRLNVCTGVLRPPWRRIFTRFQQCQYPGWMDQPQLYLDDAARREPSLHSGLSGYHATNQSLGLRCLPGLALSQLHQETAGQRQPTSVMGCADTVAPISSDALPTLA